MHLDLHLSLRGAFWNELRGIGQTIVLASLDEMAMYTIHGTIIHLSPNQVSTDANPLEWPSTYFLVYMFSQILWDCQYQNTTMRKRRIQSADIASYINIVSELKGVTDSPGHSQEIFIVRISARAQTDGRQHKATIFRAEKFML